MTPDTKDFYKDVKAAHQTIYVWIEELKSTFYSNFQDQEIDDVVDVIFAMKETLKYLEDARKDINKMVYLLSKISCVTAIDLGMEKIKTEYCTGTVHESATYNYPHRRDKDPERFDALMEHLGIPASTAMRELVRPNWPALQDYFQKLLEEGKPLPPGIELNDCNEVFEMRTRKRPGKEILSED